MSRWKRGDKSEYALYKGDTFIDLGTAEELAEKHNFKLRTIYYMTEPSYRKRMRKKRILCL